MPHLRAVILLKIAIICKIKIRFFQNKVFNFVKSLNIMTDKELVASLAVAQKETDKQIRQTQKQLGELGNKWGSFTEGMAISSIQKILLEEFKMPVISQNVVKRMNGETIEMDAFGYENSTINTAIIVEIKSHLKETAIEQLEETMANFPKFFSRPC